MNRPFYRYGGHIELIEFKEYYGMSRGHKHDPMYSYQYLRAFRDNFSFKFSYKNIVMGLKVVEVLFLPEKRA